MDLRDYFAARAMQGMFSIESVYQQFSASQIAEYSYTLADAMLEARKVGIPECDCNTQCYKHKTCRDSKDNQEKGEWLKWNGGPCPPVDVSRLVDVKYHDGSIVTNILSGLVPWKSDNAPYIISYRIVK